jgi:hypothetical protein
MDPATTIIDPTSYAVLPPADVFEFKDEAEFFATCDEAMERARDWAVEVSQPVRVYVKECGQWVIIRVVEPVKGDWCAGWR